MNPQSFTASFKFPSMFTAFFIQLVFAILLIYAVLAVLAFLTRKATSVEAEPRKFQLKPLLVLLSKLFMYSALGFIASNIIGQVLNRLGGSWVDLTFGIAVLCIGFGFRAMSKVNSSEL